MGNLKIIKEKKSDTLVFSDKLLKEDIRELKKEILASIDRSDKITIKFDGLKKTDIFFVQLLCAAHKYAVKKEKNLEIPDALPEQLKTVIENYGFYREKGCIKENEDNCFWLKEVTNV